MRNPDELRPVSYGFFSKSFRDWVRALALPPSVADQARHTLATNLIKAGASLPHIRRYLGQVSDRMAEHYVQVAHLDFEDLLNTYGLLARAPYMQENSLQAVTL